MGALLERSEADRAFVRPFVRMYETCVPFETVAERESRVAFGAFEIATLFVNCFQMLVQVAAESIR